MSLWKKLLQVFNRSEKIKKKYCFLTEKQEIKTNTKAMKGIVNALLMHYKKEKEFNEKKIQFYLKKKGEIIGKNREDKREFNDKNMTMSGFFYENSRDFIRDFAISVHGFIYFFIEFSVNFLIN